MLHDCFADVAVLHDCNTIRPQEAWAEAEGGSQTMGDGQVEGQSAFLFQGSRREKCEEQSNNQSWQDEQNADEKKDGRRQPQVRLSSLLSTVRPSAGNFSLLQVRGNMFDVGIFGQLLGIRNGN